MSLPNSRRKESSVSSATALWPLGKRSLSKGTPSDAVSVSAPQLKNLREHPRERPTVSRAEVVYETFGGVVCVVMFSAVPVTAVDFAWCPSDADFDVACLTHRCKTSDLDQESEVTGLSTGEAKHF